MIGRSGQKQKRRRPEGRSENTQKRYLNYYKSEQSEHVVKKSKDVFSKRNVVREIKGNARTLPTYIASAVIFVSLGWVLTLNGHATVVVGSATGLRSVSYYQTSVNNLMSNDLSSKTKISFDTHAFRDKIKSAIPEVDSVSISVPIVGRQIGVGLTFVKPAYLYTVNTVSYVLGSSGVILAEAKDVQPNVLKDLKQLTDVAPLSVRVGQAVLLSSDISFIDTMFSQMSAAKREVKSVTLPEGAGELLVSLKDSPYVIKYSLLGDVSQQVGAYLSTITQLENEAAVPLEYIDVRLGERVFVK